MISEAGIQFSSAERAYLVVTDPVRLSDGDKYIFMEPYSGFKLRTLRVEEGIMELEAVRDR